jgi:hypothetical protein
VGEILRSITTFIEFYLFQCKLKMDSGGGGGVGGIGGIDGGGGGFGGGCDGQQWRQQKQQRWLVVWLVVIEVKA